MLAAALGVASVSACGRAPTVPVPEVTPSGPASAAPPPSASAGSSASAAAHLVLPAEVVNGPRDRPAVALTFHGQGDAAIVRGALAALAAGGAKATVLAVGAWLRQQPGLATLVLDGGHELGNHTENHLNIAGMTEARMFAEINDCAATLRSLTGSAGTWFRPSQTVHSTPAIRAQAAKAGYPTCLSYDLDSLDYTDPGADAVVRTTLAQVRNGSIVSLHFGHAGTVTALPGILDGLRAKGLHAVTMTELMS
jgi:peptidoglycan/xylan/chitin deacetylase (PgdA/CDA1 family)